ncbi:MAG: hypothetical protein AAGA48_19155 [Myxococcota bacterium]
MNVKPTSTSSVLQVGPIFGLLALLLAWSWATETGRIGYRGIREAPPGTEHVLSLFTVTRVDPGGYRLTRGNLNFDVVANPTGLETGQEVTTLVLIDPGGRLVEQWREEAPQRDGKKRLGVLGLVLAGGVALLTLRVGRKGVIIRG